MKHKQLERPPNKNRSSGEVLATYFTTAFGRLKENLHKKRMNRLVEKLRNAPLMYDRYSASLKIRKLAQKGANIENTIPHLLVLLFNTDVSWTKDWNWELRSDILQNCLDALVYSAVKSENTKKMLFEKISIMEMISRSRNGKESSYLILEKRGKERVYSILPILAEKIDISDIFPLLEKELFDESERVQFHVVKAFEKSAERGIGIIPYVYALTEVIETIRTEKCQDLIKIHTSLSASLALQYAAQIREQQK
ncbi:hypothetical protein KAW38_04365 [Candidatus Micrarchaeota archaeon]|nr:hypothetical protein [Candidatus Micrarchaeota archaeon]